MKSFSKIFTYFVGNLFKNDPFTFVVLLFTILLLLLITHLDKMKDLMKPFVM